ncbi:MAG TPA: LuxR C-terminal-related transcriptional regulator [Streptosporangiaceae bacterium]|nr:LuxR C-terminal-related transcriptional regulator [Streptosporangiaceae bacterium]
MDGPGAAAAAAEVHGFPAALTSFVGREEAVHDVAGLLEEFRLVTVTGPGGMGKTRLAGQVARQVAARFTDGAWLAELAPVRDPAQLAAVVAAALGIQEQSGTPLADTLAQALAGQQLLLVLDNCEHVLGTAAQLCASLLAACDDVRVLATSREPLAAAGEARYRLAPLTLPAPGDTAASGRSESVALFADRARQADARFALDEQDGPAMARLVARLDGMPLAIELAAARAETLGVAQLLDRIEDRFALLTGGDRLAADRQRSLAATVAWSYDLLTEDERRVFRALSVFPAGFTLEGAEAVAGPGADPVVLRLVDCSLVVPPRAGLDGRSRYAMLETLRAYGARRLAETGEQDKVAAALARYALRTARQAAAGLRSGDGELAAARWLDADDATMRQALAWAMEQDPSVALPLALALAWWWLLRGRLVGEYRLLGQAASHAEAGSGGWYAAQIWLGMMAQFSGDLTAALGHFTTVRDAAAVRDPATVRDAVASRALSRALTNALANRAGVLLLMGRAAEATDDARRALALARETGNPAEELMALTNLSLSVGSAGDHDEALRLARQAGQITAGIPGGLARYCSSVLTAALAGAGDLAEAERVSAAGLAQARDAGDLWNQVFLLPRIADLDMLAGRTGAAAEHLREGLSLAMRTGTWFQLLAYIFQCGALCAATGRAAEALTLWAAWAVAEQREAHPYPPWFETYREESLRAARQALGPGQARAAEDRGAAMSLSVAAEYALMLTAPDPQPTNAAGAGQLSAREQELVALVAQGRTNAQIAAELHISIRTVGSHLDRIRDKTGCRRRTDLTRLALSARLV